MKSICFFLSIVLLISMPLSAQKTTNKNTNNESKFKILENRVDTLEVRLAEIINYLNSNYQELQNKQAKNIILKVMIKDYKEEWIRNGQEYYDAIFSKIKKEHNLEWIYFQYFTFNIDGYTLSRLGYEIELGYFASKKEAMNFYSKYIQVYKEIEFKSFSLVEDK